MNHSNSQKINPTKISEINYNNDEDCFQTIKYDEEEEFFSHKYKHKYKNNNNKKVENKSSQNILNENSTKDKQIFYEYKIGQYLIQKTIGQGTFGKVKLGIYIPTKEKVAIKILEKEKMTEKDDEIRVKREFDMLKEFNHPNVIMVTEIFESVDSFYSVMEFCEGGELFNYIVEKKRIPEDEASFFYYQIISGLEYIHSLGIVHRDLKPENLLLTHDHLIKIIDFGLSNYYKENNSELLITPCGSPCYASPEMVAGKKYDGIKIDIWSTGIILYAMLCGYLPFEDKDNDKLFNKIMECKVIFPHYISNNARDLIKKILVIDPNERISINDIKNHPFYKRGKFLFNEMFTIKKIQIKNEEESKNDSNKIKNNNSICDDKNKTSNEITGKTNKDLEENKKNEEKKENIEEIIANFKERKIFEIPIDSKDNIKKIDIQKYNTFLTKVELQKNKTNNYKELLDFDNKYSQIRKDENELKYLIKKKDELKKEYDYLQNIDKKQAKDIDFLFSRNFKSSQIAEISKKLNELKENYINLNKNYKSLNIIIKNQYTEINALEAECDLIKDNIEYKKKQKIKCEYNDLINETKNIDNYIQIIKNQIKQKKIIILDQEDYYKNELIVQKKKKDIIEDELRLLESKLAKYYKRRKINELRIREIGKIKREIEKNRIIEKKEKSLLRLRQQKENIKMFNLNKFKKYLDNSGDGWISFDLRKYFLEEEKNKTIKRHNLNISKFNSRSCVNIFAEKQLNREKEKEKEEIIQNVGYEIEELETQRGKVIKEIEYLKGDIENVLNRNDIIDKSIIEMKKDRNINNKSENKYDYNYINNNNFIIPENNNKDIYIKDNNNDINLSTIEYKKTNNSNQFDFAFSNK